MRFSVLHSWSGDRDSPTLAILLPGRGYSNQMPLIYYSRAVLEIEGADHGLERSSSSENLDILKTYITRLEQFLGQELSSRPETTPRRPSSPT